MIPGHQLAEHFAGNIRLAEGLRKRAIGLSHSISQAVDTVTGQLDQALADLAEAYLPELTQAALDDLAARASFKKLERRSPLDAMAHEKLVLERRIGAIEQDERYVRRQWLVGPHGELTRELEERKSLLQPWEEACARFEQHEHFLTLVQLGYDTPGYDVGFLEARYWTYWAAGDRICRELGMDDFGDDVLPAYQKVDVERVKWRAEVGATEHKINTVHELVREHDQALARIPRLPEIYLQASREALVEFLRMADLPLLAEWNAQQPVENREVTLGLRRASGLKAKLEILDDLLLKGIKPFMQDLGGRITKYKRKVAKFQRSKNYHSGFPRRHLDTKFGDKQDKYNKRLRQAEQMVQRMVAYDAYDRFVLAENPTELWFKEMTGSKPSRMFPTWRGWYERAPDARPGRDEGRRPRAGGAVARDIQAGP